MPSELRLGTRLTKWMDVHENDARHMPWPSWQRDMNSADHPWEI